MYRLCQVNTEHYLSIFVATVPLQQRTTWRVFACGLRIVCGAFAVRLRRAFVRLRVARRRAFRFPKSSGGPQGLKTRTVPPGRLARYPVIYTPLLPRSFLNELDATALFWCALLVRFFKSAGEPIGLTWGMFCVVFR